jgi:imidazolonepropionase-like amidohydrolase
MCLSKSTVGLLTRFPGDCLHPVRVWRWWPRPPGKGLCMSTEPLLHLLAGWLVDGSGGPVRRRVLLSIQGGMIGALAFEVDAQRPANNFLELSECTIVPGLVDCHVHLAMSGDRTPRVREQQGRMPFDEARGVIAGHLMEHAAHGVMAVRDGGDHAAHVLAFRERLLPDERFPVALRCAGRAWHARGRYGRFLGRPPAPGETLADSVQRCEDAVDVLKVIQSGVNSLTEFGRPTPSQFPFPELRAAVAMAADRGLKTMVHANGVVPVQEALEAGCHSVEHGYFMGRANLERLARQQIAWVPTVVPMAAYGREPGLTPQQADVARRTVDHQMEQLRMARALGVMVALGTDSGSLGVGHGRAVAEELELFIDAGYPLEAAVQCATAHAARLLGLDGELGRLVPGMPASFVVIEGPPKDFVAGLTTPHSVWNRGRMLEPIRQERR